MPDGVISTSTPSQLVGGSSRRVHSPLGLPFCLCARRDKDGLFNWSSAWPAASCSPSFAEQVRSSRARSDTSFVFSVRAPVPTYELGYFHPLSAVLHTTKSTMGDTGVSAASGKPSATMSQRSLIILLWASQMFSMMADDIQKFALKIHSHDESMLNMTGFIIAVEVPALLISPLAGAFVDRSNKYQAIFVADIIAVLSTAILAATVLHDDADTTSWPIIFCASALSSIANVMQFPAFQALMRTHVSPDDMAMFTQSAPALSMLIAPLLGAQLLEHFGLKFVFSLGGISWALATGVLLFCKQREGITAPSAMPPIQKEAQASVADTPAATDGVVATFWSLVADAREAVQLVANHRILQAAGALMLAGFLAVGVTQTMMMPLVLALADRATLGYVMTFSGAGAILGLGFPKLLKVGQWPGRLYVWLSLGQAGLLAACAIVPSAWLLLAIAAVYMMLIPTTRSCRLALIHGHVPARMTGRILSMQKGIMQACVPLAAAVGGPIYVLLAPLLEDYRHLHPEPAAATQFLWAAGLLFATAIVMRPDLTAADPPRKKQD
ncbi:uncharacterized protein MONBRDRAFT_6223 [Monosiga brevicollis MX1]|uniref:Major facilitator superfamily (MFS) profile domain-containing protein n=1 Tax=Monosiga brevicollis TaxID=81824 RepID=A9UT72_MONBE|nr:uncharacterized protein MONBRDRAFT_6223 [Monosiga brevicollis MX1]EDQ91196.1 predicted protein [Monosiga brevicollis MX1]|eukprot:XP_001743618.1 hypothetical protein [Monosiga brevicollis MX1]